MDITNLEPMDFDRKLRSENVLLLEMAANHEKPHRATKADLRAYLGMNQHNAFLDAMVC